MKRAAYGVLALVGAGVLFVVFGEFAGGVRAQLALAVDEHSEPLKVIASFVGGYLGAKATRRQLQKEVEGAVLKVITALYPPTLVERARRALAGTKE